MSRSKNSHPSSPTSLHGPKTRSAIMQQMKLHTQKDGSAAGPREVPDSEIADVHEKEINGELNTGKHRLAENRVQHDQADKNSDKNRLAADAKRHKHGNPHGKLNGGPPRH
ncbi:MAG: hypothetical protein ACM34L_00295 [Gemmatimonas sp.]|nr:hypothetical protein [Gemmatimonadaceae bacterium]